MIEHIPYQLKTIKILKSKLKPKGKIIIEVPHAGWFLKRKPGGHNFYKKVINEELNYAYCESLKKIGQTDTLIAIAE